MTEASSEQDTSLPKLNVQVKVLCPKCGKNEVQWCGRGRKPSCVQCKGLPPIKVSIPKEESNIPAGEVPITHIFQAVPCRKCGVPVWWRGNGRTPACRACGGIGELASGPMPHQQKIVTKPQPLPEQSFGQVLREALHVCTDLVQQVPADASLSLLSQVGRTITALADLIGCLRDQHMIVADWEVLPTP